MARRTLDDNECLAKEAFYRAASRAKTSKHDLHTGGRNQGRIACASAIAFITLVACEGAGAQAIAQPISSPNTAELDTIIVTAQKRSESINDVPMSITALTGAQLVEDGVTDVEDLVKVVPGFSVQKSTYGPSVFTIRGIGFYDFVMGADPTVATYMDQVPLPYSIMTRGATLDLERVEVLKGPQGTLFGQNSTGGAINFIAAKPTRTFEAGGDVSYGRFNDTIIDAFVSGPLADEIAARFAVSHEGADGSQYSTTRPTATNGRKNFTNTRLLLDWAPRDTLRFELALSGWWDRGDPEMAQFEGFFPAVPANPLTQFTYNALSHYPIAPTSNRAADWDPNFDFARHDDFYQVSLRSDWDVAEHATLTSITAYSHLVANEPIDPDGTAYDDFREDNQAGFLTSLSEELRVSGSVDRFTYMVGGNFQKEVADQTNTSAQLSTQSSLLGFYTAQFANITNQQPTTSSGFASLDFAADDRLTLQASARYTHEHRDFEGCLADAGPGSIGVRSGIPFGLLSSGLSGSSVFIPQGGCITLSSATFLPGVVQKSTDTDNVSWRGGLKWNASDLTLLYANATKGYKAGSYSQVPGVLSDEYQQVKQESLLAYETGIKQTTRDRQFEVTGAVFYYDYRNKQLLGDSIFPIFNALPVLINIPKSRVYGSELGFTLRPIAPLTISGGVTYVNSRVQADPTQPYSPVDPLTGASTSYIGEGFPNTPDWQGVADAEYDFPLQADLVGFVGTTGTFRSRSYAAFGDEPSFQLNSYALIDARAGMRSGDKKWEAELWGKNVTDKYYWVGVTHLIDTLDRIAGNPATFGVSARYRF